MRAFSRHGAVWTAAGCAATLALIGLAACEQKSAAQPASVPAAATAPAGEPLFRITATIQDLMVNEVDPSGDHLWESVGVIVTESGTEERQPRTDEEWREARRAAITLAEAANLLVMDGRRIAAPGKKLEDEGVDGIYTAAEAQAAIDARRPQFIEFAHGLHGVAETMLKAIDARDTKTLFDQGEKLDAVCEGCHMTFWYPNQIIPPSPSRRSE